MNTKCLLAICFVVAVISCRKGDCPPDEKPKPTDPPVADIPSIRLKDMSVEKLPSPNYHFVYNDSGYITQVSYASGLTQYDITYSGKKILKIETNKDAPFDINKDRLDYEYSNGDPAVIKVTNKNGVLYRRCLLTFLPSHRLQKLTWEVNPGTGFAAEQTLTFSYYADGNLQEIAYHDFPVGPLVENTYTDRFENYDNKVNVDGFTWLHTITSVHHPILLPSVKLQINNPGRNVHTASKGLSYDARYSYTYDAQGRPLTKTGPITYTESTGGGGQFQSFTTFTYY
jgi:hypothetical protein